MKKIVGVVFLLICIIVSAFSIAEMYVFTFDTETPGGGKVIDLSEQGLSIYLPKGFEQKKVLNNDSAIFYYERNKPWHSVEFLTCNYRTLDEAESEYEDTTPLEVDVNGMDCILFAFTANTIDGSDLYVCDVFIDVPNYGVVNYYEESGNSQDIARYLANIVPYDEREVLATAALNAPSEEKENDPYSKEKDYKAKCKLLDYRSVERYPDRYKGAYAKVSGQVIQVEEGWFNSAVYRVRENEDNVWYVRYTHKESEPRILEDDIVTFYGTCKGITTYTALFGNSITVPQLDAEYMTIE